MWYIGIGNVEAGSIDKRQQCRPFKRRTDGKVRVYMGIIKKGKDIAKNLGANVDRVPAEVMDFLLDRANRMLQEEQADREAFAAELDGFSDDDLRVFIPDVYQKSIYKIDYRKLKEKGIELISFDIDDTITDSFRNKARGTLHITVTMPRDAKELFHELKVMGFKVVLLTNTTASIAKDVCAELKADGYIARADKPETRNFEKLMAEYGIEPPQMAHVGNSMRQDIAGGNKANVTTCLVRRAGYSLKVVKFFMKGTGLPTKGHLIRQKLLERGLWRKHHKDVKGDQYYQLGELPRYQEKRTSPLGNIAEAAAADLITKFNADRDKTFTLEEIQRSICKSKESAGMKTLRTHLRDDIVFTGVWADVTDERELDEAELRDGELSGSVFTIGSFMIRSSVCLYRDDDEVQYTQKIPAGPDEIAQYMRERRPFPLPGCSFREVQVISAKRKDAVADDWTFVCLATASVSWDESIDFICTVKYASSDPDEREMLFVLKQYTGDSFSVAYWYKLLLDGTVTEYSEHPYSPESFTEPWDDAT